MKVRILPRPPSFARVMQLADIESSNLSFSQFESEREYGGVMQTAKLLRLKRGV